MEVNGIMHILGIFNKSRKKVMEHLYKVRIELSEKVTDCKHLKYKTVKKENGVIKKVKCRACGKEKKA